MTEEDKKLLDRINEYAERKLNDPDKKMRVSSQLGYLCEIYGSGNIIQQCQVLEYRRKYDPE